MVSNIRRTLLACLQVYKQWGKATTETGRDPTLFPIAFPNAIFSVVAVSNYTSFAISGLTLTRFRTTIGSDTGDGILWWIAVGKQQWGFGESPYATPTTYTYPLAYSVNALNVVIGSVGGRESTCRINSVSKDSFVAYRHYSGSGTGSGDMQVTAVALLM